MDNNSKITEISPESIGVSGYSLEDNAIIPNFSIVGSFDDTKDKVELFLYDYNGTLLSNVLDFRDYSNTNDTSITNTKVYSSINLDPEKDIRTLGYDNGLFKILYNFKSNHLGTSFENNTTLYISEISSDRTEIRLQSNTIDDNTLSESYKSLVELINNTSYFDEFYVNFGENRYFVAINIAYDDTTIGESILIKLYEPLPIDIDLKSECEVVTKPTETIAYQVELLTNYENVVVKNYIKGPNLNINVKDQVNVSTDYMSSKDLLTSVSSSYLNQLNSILEDKSLEINIDYSNYEDFVLYSSAKQRVLNFYQKVCQIQTYQSEISVVGTGSYDSSSVSYRTNDKILLSKIDDIITNFDGYEYFLYYGDTEYSWPKISYNQQPELYQYNSVEVLTWLGSDDYISQYYGGILKVASDYDDKNNTNLIYTIPEFIRENPDNEPSLMFTKMIGQLYDSIWIYIKSITDKYNNDNRLYSGISKYLVSDVLKSFGFKVYPSSHNNENLYNSFIGINPEYGYSLPTGSEKIDTIIEMDTSGSYTTDDVTNSIYKRIYNNITFLLKKKGTIQGIRELVNIYGVPDTILRINEFGNIPTNEVIYNEDGAEPYDLFDLTENNKEWYQFYNRYSYEFKFQESSSILVPWLPTQFNYLVRTGSSQYWVDNTGVEELLNPFGYKYYVEEFPWESSTGSLIVPDSIEFRFKTEGIPNPDRYKQTLLSKKTNSDSNNVFDIGIDLQYTPPITGSFTGQPESPYIKYGSMSLYLGNAKSEPIYLPFYDAGWWSVLLQRDTHVPTSSTGSSNYTLTVKNKLYNGFDGNVIGFTGSISITGSDIIWNSTSSISGLDGYYFGGYINGVDVGSNTLTTSNKIFSGSIAEIRYYDLVVNDVMFNDYVMNPESILGSALIGPSSSYNALSFRAALGNELETYYTSSVSNLVQSSSYTSIHPKVNNVNSFIKGSSSFSDYHVIYYPTTKAIYPFPTGGYQSVINTTNCSNKFKIEHDRSVKSLELPIAYDPTKNVFIKPQEEIYYLHEPIVGIENKVNDHIKIEKNKVYGKVLSNQKSLDQSYQINQNFNKGLNNLEIVFSPQDEINDDIAQTYGKQNLMNLFGDPKSHMTNSDIEYKNLKILANDYFTKYNHSYNVFEFSRLLKYFDNSLFRVIKDFVPARTSLSTGLLIKQHLLERNRIKPIIPIVEDLTLFSEIKVGSFKGGTGGTLDIYNNKDFKQGFSQSIHSPLGIINEYNNYQYEFYNGEFSGSYLDPTDGELNRSNKWKYPNVGDIPKVELVYYFTNNTADNVLMIDDNTQGYYFKDNKYLHPGGNNKDGQLYISVTGVVNTVKLISYGKGITRPIRYVRNNDYISSYVYDLLYYNNNITNSNNIIIDNIGETFDMYVYEISNLSLYDLTLNQ